MSPEAPIRSTKPEAMSNLYTVILAVAFGAVLATAAFVAVKCYFDYNTLFTIP
ncbi:MAG: hypothetical protein ABSB11_10090 [Sedimentisphaerales bacterium]|jgi:hypothetical protein